MYEKSRREISIFNLNIFKKPSDPESPEPQPNRCHFQHQNGRRCRLPVAGESTEFCGTHRDLLALAKTKEEQAAETAAITTEIYGPVKSLDSAVAINHVLGNLFRLTLEGRIPQRKAALLTSMCRTLLRTVEAARAEITTAKLFPHNNADLLNLLALLNGDEAESETVAPQSTAAAFSTHNSVSHSEPEHTVVAAGLDRPGSRQPASHEKTLNLSKAINRAHVAPQSTAAISPEFIPISATTNDLPLETQDEIAYPIEPAVSSTSVPPQSQSTNSAPQFSDGVCWIGPKPDQIDWGRIEKEKRDYERYLRRAYPPTMNGYHHIPPDKIPLWWRPRRRR